LLCDVWLAAASNAARASANPCRGCSESTLSRRSMNCALRALRDPGTIASAILSRAANCAAERTSGRCDCNARAWSTKSSRVPFKRCAQTGWKADRAGNRAPPASPDKRVCAISRRETLRCLARETGSSWVTVAESSPFVAADVTIPRGKKGIGLVQNKSKPEFDVIVVGSGASGGWASKRLAEAGLKVALLEAGQSQTERNFTEHKTEVEMKYRKH